MVTLDLVLRVTNCAISPSSGYFERIQSKFEITLSSFIQSISFHSILFFQMGKNGCPRSRIKARELENSLKTLKREIKEQTKYLQQFKARTNSLYYEQTVAKNCEYDPSVDYHSEFWKVFLFNETILPQLRSLVVETGSLERGVERLQHMIQKYGTLYRLSQRTKHRRSDAEITKRHLCPYPECFKVYATDISLNLHIKIKHNGGTKKERIDFANAYIHAKQTGRPIPPTSLNVPDCYLKLLMEEIDKPKFSTAISITDCGP